MHVAEKMTFEDLVDWYVRQLVLYGDAENAEIIRNAFACGEPTVALDMAVIRSKQLNIIHERHIIKRSCELLDPDDDGMEICKRFLTVNGFAPHARGQLLTGAISLSHSGKETRC